MTVRGGDTWRGLFCTKDATGALAVPGVGPAGALYVNGALNGAAVAIAGANPYSFSVVLPVLAVADRVSMYITATIAGVATAGVVAEESADTALVSDVILDTNDIQGRLPAALVAGRMDSSVGAMANNTLTAAAIATGAIDADALDVTATDEITDSVWAEALPGAYAAGSAGFILGNIVATLTAALTASAAFLAAIAGAVWSWATRTLTSWAHLVGSVRLLSTQAMNLQFCRGETYVVNVAIQYAGGGAFDLTGYDVYWALSQKRGSTALLTKSTVAGTITVISAPQGSITFTISATESWAQAAENYVHEIHIRQQVAPRAEHCALHGHVEITDSTIGVIP